MKHTIRRHLALLAVVAVAGGVHPATASDDNVSSLVSAFAADGRELVVGSVAAQGARVGDVCTFAEGATAVTMIAPEGVDSSVAVRADDACRLTVVELTASGGPGDLGVHVGDLADAAVGEPTFDRPKVPRTGAGTSPSSVGGVDVRGDLGLPTAGELAATAFEAAATETEIVEVFHTFYSAYARVDDKDHGIIEYQDWWRFEYVRNHRTRKVSHPYFPVGRCRAGYKFLGPVNPLQQDCWYEEQHGKKADGTPFVRVHAGGEYMKFYGPSMWDTRVITETYEATYSQETVRSCDPAGTLPPGWVDRCYFEYPRR